MSSIFHRGGGGKKSNETHVWCSEVDPGRWKRMETETVEGWVEGIGRSCVPWNSAVKEAIKVIIIMEHMHGNIKLMDVVVMMIKMMMLITMIIITMTMMMTVAVVVMMVNMVMTMSVDNDSVYGKDYEDDDDDDVKEKSLLLLLELLFDCQSESRYMCKRVDTLFLCIVCGYVSAEQDSVCFTGFEFKKRYLVCNHCLHIRGIWCVITVYA